ncbi:MAG TPA: cobyrinic acid a,c-diamide synthase [Clostridiaceae bacterium]|nr:cobyrinic acid a,c-diamide synthase [Clostridiaceae bacterium]
MNEMIIAGTSSNVGKTTITMGILKWLQKEGYNVGSFKVGPDYIDPQFHAKALGERGHNLDLVLMGKKGVVEVYEEAMNKAEVSVIEGVMGLYDGDKEEGVKSSTAEVAKLLHVPVILILQGEAMAETAGAIVLGCQKYDEDLRIAGVIVNGVSSKAHYRLIEASIQKKTGIPVLGFVPKDPVMAFPSRHLGLSIDALGEDPIHEQLLGMANFLEKHLDFPKLLSLTMSRKKAVPSLKKHVETTIERPVRIGYALDEAFSFYYKRTFELLQKAGVELIPFSPLKDQVLPKDLDGLYFGGGYPELQGEGLSGNVSFRKDLLKRLDQGIPTLAEGGGYMYLCETLVDLQGQVHEMVGFFTGQSIMTKKLQGFGYRGITLGEKRLLGHEYRHSYLVEEGDAFLCDGLYDHGKPNFCQGQHKKNAYGSYVHVHLLSNLEVVEEAVTLCRDWRLTHGTR